MVEPPNSSDKLILSISFLTVLVGLYAYKDLMNQVKVTIFSQSFSIFVLFVYMSGILCISIYLSSLANLRYRYEQLSQSKFLKLCDQIGDLFYLFAVIGLPTTVIGGYIISVFFMILSQTLSNMFEYNLDFNLISKIAQLLLVFCIMIYILKIYIKSSPMIDEELIR